MANAGVYRSWKQQTTRDFEFTGADCTGSNGVVNRTLTLEKETGIDTEVKVNKATLIKDSEYTASGKVLTFLVKIYNTNVIVARV